MVVYLALAIMASRVRAEQPASSTYAAARRTASISREERMARIGFIGLGNMGLPMARNLAQGRASGRQASTSIRLGGSKLATPAERHAAPRRMRRWRRVDVVITMLPAGKHVREVYLGEHGIIATARNRARC